MRSFRFSVVLTALALTGAAPASAQMSATDAVVRLEAIENQMRQLTGQIEQLQFRNQQLEQALRRIQEDSEFRFQQLGAKGAAPGAAQSAQPAPTRPAPPLQQIAPPAAVQPPPGRRSDAGDANDISSGPSPIRPISPGRRADVFDPAANPNAPGAPRPLGALPAGQPSAPQIMTDEQPIGARGGREPGTPLNLSTLANDAPGDAAALPSPASGAGLPAPQPPQRNAGAVAAVAPVTQVAQSPKEEYDAAYAHIQSKDYALAEQGFREFLRKHMGDRLVPDAQYWLGESLFQRQLYRDAAENFLNLSTKFETSAKAPESLLRLGQSLAALGEKNAACATLAEIGRKYPRASLGVKRGAEREQKRASC